LVLARAVTVLLWIGLASFALGLFAGGMIWGNVAFIYAIPAAFCWASR
jgi:hypothetical protein